ncbi:MAG: EAL domain-containing protein [Sterolibacterium sp.]|jgi:diguanylate cyclase (GGDEF)-like protein/PAS domain S-box-containing protein
MLATTFAKHSLKTRIIVATLTVFLLSIWLIAFIADRLMHDDLKRLLGNQQFATASIMAKVVNDEISGRLMSMEKVAQRITVSDMGNPETLQRLLEDRRVFGTLFNAGISIVTPDGTVIADAPSTTGRLRRNFMHIDYIAQVLTKGTRSIGKPIIGPVLKRPVFGMAVPIRDARGTIIGALSGVTNLSKPNFLDAITEGNYGQTGGLLLIAPEYRLIVAATDKSRIMETLPAPSVNLAIDRFVGGYEGSQIFVNPKGVEVLASTKGVPVAGWYVTAQFPTAEAFSPIDDMRLRILAVTIVMTLLVGLVILLVLKHHLTPMLATIKTLTKLADSKQPPGPLPIHSNDEIGELIGGFNCLLASLSQRDAALRESKQQLRLFINYAPAAIAMFDREMRYIAYSRRWLTDYGLGDQEITGRSHYEVFPDIPERWKQIHQRCLAGASESCDEDLFPRSDDSVDWVRWEVHPWLSGTGVIGGIIIFSEVITRRRQAEEQLRKLSLAVEQSPESVVITNLNAEIEYVNEAFVGTTGYSREEVLGRNPRILNSGKTPRAAYPALWDALTSGRTWQGELINRRKDGSEYIEHAVITPIRQEDGRVTHYVAVKEDITARKAADKQINTLAFFDPLTGLPNRRLLLDRLQQALASSKRNNRDGALLFIDLDNFKTLNDTLGHEIGDLLLKQAGQRLATCIREGDSVARLGDDEFVVMLEDLGEIQEEAAAQTKIVGEKILSALSHTYQLSSHTYHSTASIGATLFSGRQERIDDLLKQADMAMHRAKAAGRNTMRFFDPEMQTLITVHAALEADLRDALANNQLLLYYQAQVIGESRVTGVEALVRWQHPQRGLVSPAEFIPLAEETGLILPLGLWVLQTACLQLAAWSSRQETAELTVAVNVSARQFRQADFVDQVTAVLDATGANPRRLKLELTESLLVDDVESVILKMVALRGKGVGFSLDDFGTGYSSLSYLKRLPLDQLKIDQGFVRGVLTDPNDAAIAKMVMALADSMGLAVIAEGVEIEGQRSFLARHGCHAYQGYLFSRPLPLAEFEELIERG